MVQLRNLVTFNRELAISLLGQTGCICDTEFLSSPNVVS